VGQDGFLAKEECYARSAKKAGTTPRVMLAADQRPRVALEELWASLPRPDRQQALRTLSRIVAQIARPPVRPEVRHEDC
jgi:hypothetical protein